MTELQENQDKKNSETAKDTSPKLGVVSEILENQRV